MEKQRNCVETEIRDMVCYALAYLKAFISEKDVSTSDRLKAIDLILEISGLKRPKGNPIFEIKERKNEQ